MMFFTQQKKVIGELLKADVEFMLIGGYAVIFYGYVRTTGDMDIWLKPDNTNKVRFIHALIKSGFSKEALDHVNNSDFTQTLAFHISEPPERIDFLTKLSGLNFNDSIQRANKIQSGELLIPVLHLDDLIINKMLLVRAKDKADIEELQKINKLSENRKR